MPVDDFGAYGVTRMDDDRIRGFLSAQRVGVLGLATDGVPTMRPLSYWFDGTSTLYFQFVGADGRKAALSERAETARFLVYRAETRFNWRSALLTGTVDRVDDEERAAVEEAVTFERPDALEAASGGEETRLYAFTVEEWSGIEHLGLPPEFEDDTA